MQIKNQSVHFVGDDAAIERGDDKRLVDEENEADDHDLLPSNDAVSGGVNDVPGGVRGVRGVRCKSTTIPLTTNSAQ